MNRILKNNKGIVLIAVYFVVVVLLGLSAVIFMRTIGESRLAQRSRASLEAFYEAEAGISCAYAEAADQAFSWYTHEDKDTPVTSTHSLTDSLGTTVDFTYPAPTNMPNANIATTGSYQDCYQVTGRDFSLKSYPEKDNNGNYTGITVLLSTAEVNEVARTIEYRLNQVSAYDYFFFYPKNHNFGTATFDGRNYGGIHVNGNIGLTGKPSFYFLTELTSGSETVGEGYISRPLRYQFGNYHGEVQYSGLSSYVYRYTTAHFYTGDAYFKTGDVNDPNPTITLPYYLEGSGTYYEYDKYSGDGSNTTPMHYVIGNEDLKDVAIYELVYGTGSAALFDQSNTVQFGSYSGTEKDVFGQLFNDHPDDGEELWNQFWNQWKTNHENDYLDYVDQALSKDNWQRRFYRAAYNWPDEDDGAPNGVNMEWWEDLSFGDDRSSLIDDMAPAEVESYYTGEGLGLYFLNTKEQVSAWADWLSEKGLDEYGDNQTLVQDRSQGGKFVNPGDVMSKFSEQGRERYKEEAIDGGIFIGRAETQAYKDWLAQIQALNQQNNNIWQQMQAEYLPYLEQVWAGEITWEEFWEIYNAILSKYQDQLDELQQQLNDLWANPPERYQQIDPIVEDFAVEKQFYNTQHPVTSWEFSDGSWHKTYKPANLLVIDVHELKETVEEKVPDFNGVVYIELESYLWSSPSYNYNADGVMLINGERLPDGGLGIVSSNNIYIKGNYNLDSYGDLDRNRNPDDADVIQRVIENKGYIFFESDLEWQPAEIITNRAVYTLSEDFPEPSYMPMCSSYSNQYYDERDGYVPDQDFVSGHSTYPTDSWVPSPSQTYDVRSRVKQWFTYYRDENNESVSVPSEWSQSWVDTFWPSSEIFAFDTTGPDGVPDGEPDIYMKASHLRSDVTGHIQSAYQDTYNYTAIHGSGGTDSPDTASKINGVSKKHIYNTTIVTPYSTFPYVLEYWGSTDRIINGVFINLLDTWEFKASIPSGSGIRSRGVDNPDNFFNYETRFGKNSQIRAPVNPTFGAESSWREIGSTQF